MKKNNLITKIGLAMLMVSGFTASAWAYPTLNEIATTYHFKATLNIVDASYTTQVSALESEFDFSIVSTGAYNTYITGFVLNSSVQRSINYAEATGIISMGGTFSGQLPGNSGNVYLSTALTGADDTSNIYTYPFNWQVSENGATITIPDFSVKDYTSDKIIATYTGVTVTNPKLSGGGGEPDTPDKDDYGQGPAQSSLIADYTFTAQVQYESKYAWVESSLSSQEFTLEAYSANLALYNFLKPETSSPITVTYNQEKGTLTFSNMTYIGYLMNYDDYSGAQVAIGTASGKARDSFIWGVDEDGNIVIPDFTLINTNDNSIIAKFINCKGVKKEVVEETYPYPALSELANTYDWGGTASVNLQSLYADYIQGNVADASFTLATTVNENQVSITNFLGSSAIYGTYDRNEGTITFTGQALTYTNTHETWRTQADIDDDNYPGNVTFGITDSEADAYAMTSTWVWTVSEEGEIEIPAFKVWNNYPYNGLAKEPIVTFTDINLEGGITENLPDEVVNPVIGEYKVIGTYDWKIIPTTIAGGTTLSPVTIEVEVWQPVGSDETTYYLAETDDTNYFNGNIIATTVENGKMTIPQFYAGRFEGQTVWFSGWIYNASMGMTEPQESFAIDFSVTDGFTFNEEYSYGLGWFLSGKDEFSPSDLYSGFYLPTASTVVAPEVVISNAAATVDNEVVTVTFDAEILNLAIEEVGSMEAIFTPATGETITADVTYLDGSAWAKIENLPIGEYTYSFTLVIYDENDAEIIASNALEVSFTIKTTGIGSIGSDNGDNTYYNLQGVRVANPQKGIFIINGKKVIVR
ncbi:MAG: hypothetical protein J1D77_00170 [Muribaculaceae bacterium]|nr:hypothetical protein [Muribaculaceae bacterium]